MNRVHMPWWLNHGEVAVSIITLALVVGCSTLWLHKIWTPKVLPSVATLPFNGQPQSLLPNFHWQIFDAREVHKRLFTWFAKPGRNIRSSRGASGGSSQDLSIELELSPQDLVELIPLPVLPGWQLVIATAKEHQGIWHIKLLWQAIVSSDEKLEPPATPVFQEYAKALQPQFWLPISPDFNTNLSQKSSPSAPISDDQALHLLSLDLPKVSLLGSLTGTQDLGVWLALNALGESQQETIFLSLGDSLQGWQLIKAGEDYYLQKANLSHRLDPCKQTLSCLHSDSNLGSWRGGRP